MTLISLRQSLRACYLDFAVYTLLMVGLAGSLAPQETARAAVGLLVLALLGLALWSLIEYLTHRFVLHGIQPFQGWHTEHHVHPREHLGLPTWLSLALFTALVYLPLRAMLGAASAGPLMIGVLAGYLIYSMAHHASHHWPARGMWMERRKRWHALHHQSGQARCYGVSTTFWDRALGSHLRQRGLSERSRSP
ncbi:sterol desaturase family protein [Roseateles sp.]|uniref:sterol desaturase family protein n=1 Tax=Roseateles sp. TaxID=1971397 RepID=UPI003D0C4A5B